MKMVLISYNEAMDMEVMELLQRCGLPNYTKVGHAFGKGAASGTHLGTDIWPGLNTLVFVAFPDDRTHPLLEGVRHLRKTLGHEGIKAFVWNLDEVT